MIIIIWTSPWIPIKINSNINVPKIYICKNRDISTESEINKPSSNSKLICYIHLFTNAFRKGMHPPLPVQHQLWVMDPLVLGGNQATRRKILNLKTIEKAKTKPLNYISPSHDNSQIIKKRELRRVMTA